MELIAAEDIFRGMKSIRDQVDADPDTDEWPVFRRALDLALRTIWRSEWWAELMRHEWRAFRDDWDSTVTYAAEDEVWHEPSQKHYQALRAPGVNAPATWSGTEWVTNDAYWALCAESYSGDEWEAAAYATGDIVYYSPTRRFYQAFSDTIAAEIPTDTNVWGVLTEFDSYVAKDQTDKTVIGDIFDIKTDNPKKTYAWAPVDWDNSENGGQILDDAVAPVFVQFRLAPPRIFGGLYDAEDSYVVGEQVYFNNSNTEKGDFYNCIASAAAGDTPATDTDKWERVEIPLAFYAPLTGLAAGLVTVGENHPSKTAALGALGENAATLETDVPYRQQGKTPQQSVRTYP